MSAIPMIWYVNPIGSDARDGQSSGTAFRSLSRAVEAAKPGDTIMISPGAYDQDLPAKVSAARSVNIAVAVIGSD
jgi:Protein of unknown function (DUF1565)